MSSRRLRQGETPAAAAETPAASERLGARLVLGAVATLLIAVPFMLLTVLVLAKNQWLARLDLNAAASLHAFVAAHPPLAATLRVIGRLTEPWVLRGVSLGACLVLWSRGARRLAVWLGVTMAAAGVLSVVLKLLVTRARPTFTDPVTVAGGYSFPSGHALTSMTFAACAVVLLYPVLAARARAVLWSLAVLFVVLVGYDRIALGVHYVSDVVAGWAVGLATAMATTAAFASWRRHEGLPQPDQVRGLDPEQQKEGNRA